ncbi:MAG TPA: TylF/MycF/NovP-related O-methyltransferase [Flavobacteriales bacterium]|nr:TylF/MycF/NovP-related O-methyltransferase [Flavobacteriales bacterium]
MEIDPYELGPYTYSGHYALLHKVVESIYGSGQHGYALEFGVGDGQSTRVIAKRLPVLGFDSFHGLPENWRPGYERGHFSRGGLAPQIDNAGLVTGLFEDTLPKTPWTALYRVVLVHIDCDLYSSTKTVFDNIEPIILKDKPYIVFDEWWGYEGCEHYEQRAWREFVARTGVKWSVVGHSEQQWSIKIV